MSTRRARAQQLTVATTVSRIYISARSRRKRSDPQRNDGHIYEAEIRAYAALQ